MPAHQYYRHFTGMIVSLSMSILYWITDLILKVLDYGDLDKTRSERASFKAETAECFRQAWVLNSPLDLDPASFAPVHRSVQAEYEIHVHLSQGTAGGKVTHGFITHTTYVLHKTLPISQLKSGIRRANVVALRFLKPIPIRAYGREPQCLCRLTSKISRPNYS